MYKLAEMKMVKEWPLSINEAGDYGKVTTRVAKVDFEILKQADQDAIYENGGTDIELMKRVVKGWHETEFQREDGSPLPFNEDSLKDLLARPNVRAAFVGGYLAAQQGREAARKN